MNESRTMNVFPSASPSLRIVILGAGFGGTYTFNRLHAFFHKSTRVSLVLVNCTNYFLFTPLLHEVATGSVSPENVIEPLRKVLGCGFNKDVTGCAADFCLAQVKRVRLRHRCVDTTAGVIPYDYLVLALGSRPNFYSTPGAQTHTFTLKSLDDALRLKSHFMKTFEQASRSRSRKEQEQLLHFVVVGGGPTGVELAAEMAELFFKTLATFYPSDMMSKVCISLVSRGSELLSQFSKPLRLKALHVLQRKGVTVLLDTAVAQVKEDGITFSDGRALRSATVVWVAGVRPALPEFDVQLLKDVAGRIIVRKTLQMPGFEEVVVLGDMASVQEQGSGRTLPAHAQVATKEAKIAADNIRLSIEGKEPQAFNYRRSGDLISLGQWVAVGEIGGHPVFGHFAWWLWRTVYLSKLLSLRKKIRVAVDWTLNVFSTRDISQWGAVG